MFEPAGELEEGDSSGSSDNDNKSEVEVPTPKRQKTRCPLCKKSVTFSEDIPSSVICSFADVHLELILKTPLELWRYFVHDGSFEQTLEQTILYARHDKNCPNFEFLKGEL